MYSFTSLKITFYFADFPLFSLSDAEFEGKMRRLEAGGKTNLPKIVMVEKIASSDFNLRLLLKIFLATGNWWSIFINFI